jgi:hypothetical protein
MNEYSTSLDEVTDLKEMTRDKSPKSLTIIGRSKLVYDIKKLDLKLKSKLTEKGNSMTAAESNSNFIPNNWKDHLLIQDTNPQRKEWSSSENTKRLENLLAAISAVENIKELNIRSLDLETIPLLKGNLEGVEKLNISYSTLSYLSRNSNPNCNLRIIEIDHSYLKEFPTNLDQFPKLETFSFNCPRAFGDLSIDTLGIIHIVPLIYRLDKATNEILSDKNISVEEKSKIISRIRYRNLKNLLSDGIANDINTLRKFYSNLQFRSIPRDIKFGKKLKSISINNTHCKKIPVTLFSENQIRRLDLSNNKFRIFPLEKIQNDCLQYINISWNYLKLIENPLSIIRKFKKLRYLYMDRAQTEAITQDEVEETKFVLLKIESLAKSKIEYFNGLKNKKNQKRVRKFIED